MIDFFNTVSGKVREGVEVTEGDIERYTFTSKVPVRILSRIADHLSPIIANKSTQELQIELAAKRARKCHR